MIKFTVDNAPKILPLSELSKAINILKILDVDKYDIEMSAKLNEEADFKKRLKNIIQDDAYITEKVYLIS